VGEIFSNFVALSDFKGEGRKLGHSISLRASKKGWAERLGIMIDIQIG